jgi:hypothetical protein
MPLANRHTHVGLSPLVLVSNIIVWISAVIIMGILSYFISLNNNQGDHIIYEEVIVRLFGPKLLEVVLLTTKLLS